MAATPVIPKARPVPEQRCNYCPPTPAIVPRPNDWHTCNAVNAGLAQNGRDAKAATEKYIKMSYNSKKKRRKKYTALLECFFHTCMHRQRRSRVAPGPAAACQAEVACRRLIHPVQCGNSGVASHGGRGGMRSMCILPIGQHWRLDYLVID